MNSNKYIDTKKVTARRKARFLRDCTSATDEKEIMKLAEELAEELAKKVTLESSVDDVTMAFFACGLSVYNLNKAQTIEEYMQTYIAHKFSIFYNLNDTGAIGDSIETVCHLVAMRKVWRTKKVNLHVSLIGKTDIKINGIRFEVGHNAKVWADSTIDNAMDGPFDGVIYGMINNEEMQSVYDIMQNDIKKGVTEMCKMLYVFTNKSDFLQVMQNEIGRSPTIKYRPDLHQMITVYNGSKQNAFIGRMEKGDFPTLYDYMKSLSDNDYLK